MRFRVGQRVRLIDGDEIGTVKSIDHDDEIVWVAVPVAGGEDVIDVDPADLEPAEEGGV